MAGQEGGVDATSSPSMPDNARVKTGAAVSIKKQWSFSERFFYSGDDQSVSVSDQPSWESDNNFPHNQPDLAEKNHSFPVNAALMIDGADGVRDGGNDDNTVQKAQRRSKKVSRASTVNAFVIFLKALFGVGMLSNPAVLGEVGLLLGSFCHLLIVVGCAFACYLLLSARQHAKIEVMENQRRDEEKREIYEMWRMETERRAVVQMRRREEVESSRTLHLNNVSAEITLNSSVAMVPDGPTLQVVNAGGSTANDDECRVDPILLSTVKFPSSDINAETATQSNIAAAPSCGNVQINNDLLNSKSSDDRGGSNSVTDEYHIFTEDSITTPPPPPPPKPVQVRLITYGDVAKCLVGKQASMFIVFAMVTGHVMFASGLLHLAIENLCYVVGWERLGWSYTQVYVEEDVDDRAMMRRLGHSQDEGGEHNNPDHSSDYANRSNDEEEYYFEWKGPDFIGKITLLSTRVMTVIRFQVKLILTL
jgi:peptidyl-tRNA hydrolase